MAISEKAIERKVREVRELARNSVDGFSRSPAEEERINTICRNALRGPDGDALMDYLRSITTNVVMAPTTTDAELRDREGMRRLVGILDARRRSTPKKES